MWHNQKQTKELENKVEGLLKKTPERDKEMENVEEKIRDLEETRTVKIYIKTSVTKVITKYIHSKKQ